MPKNTAAITVGRLLEVRTGAGFRTVGDVDASFDTADTAIARLPPQVRVVAVIDWRFSALMGSDTSERVRERAMLLNLRTERSAALVTSTAATKALQLARIARESLFPERRVFDQSHELVLWLDEVLTAPERTRLRAFLDEHTLPSAQGRQPDDV
jgi:hypothetical protein